MEIYSIGVVWVDNDNNILVRIIKRMRSHAYSDTLKCKSSSWDIGTTSKGTNNCEGGRNW